MIACTALKCESYAIFLNVGNGVPTLIMVVTIQLGVQPNWECSDTETG